MIESSLGFLGRILDGDGAAVGTCFQVAPGVVVTACHVLQHSGMMTGEPILVDTLSTSGRSVDAHVVRHDVSHDLAVLRLAGALPDTIIGLRATDRVPLSEQVEITGVAHVADYDSTYRYITYRHMSEAGTWKGGTVRDGVAVGRMTASGVVRGMSGAPVLDRDGRCVGVVSARFNSADNWLTHTVWVARTEDLTPLLDGITVIPKGLRRDREAWESHWEPRSRGVERLLGDDGWYFTGRRRAREEIRNWLLDAAGPPAGRVVTGSPGCGKSALLARIVTAADMDIPGHDPELDPPRGSIDVAVHARGKSLNEVSAEIARSVDLSHRFSADRLVARLCRDGHPLTVVVDALDEALAPEAIARQLLRPLAVDGGTRGIRVLVGARRSLLAVLGRAGFSVIDLDDAGYVEHGDFVAYVRRRLTSAGDESGTSRYRGRPAVVERIARAVAARAHPNFLVAQLFSRSLAQSSKTVDPDDPAWLERIPSDIDEAMDEYLAGLPGDRRRVRELLRPLAYARGLGIPAGRLWADIASRMSEENDYSATDVTWLRDGAGGALLLETTADAASGETYCRLFHQALADHLTEPWRETRHQTAIVEVLTSSVPTADGRPDWLKASRYVREHLAHHSAAAGQLDALVRQTDFLAAAEPDRLLPVLGAVTTPEARRTAALYRRGTDQPDSVDPLVRASYLEIVSRCAGADDLADAFAAAFPGRPWRTRWARWRPTSDHRLVVTGHTSWVHDVAAGALPDGTRIIATAGADGTIRAWELDTCRPFGQPLRVDGQRADTVTLGTDLDGSPLLVGGFQGAIQVWDLLSGQPRWSERSLPRTAPRVVRLGLLGDGRAFVVSADEVGGWGAVRYWDLQSGDLLAEFEYGSPVTALAVFDGPTGSTVLSADEHGVHVRDGRLGEAYVMDLPRVRSLDITKVGGSAIAVAGFAHPYVYAWDLASREPFGPALEVPQGGNPITGIAAVTTSDGRPVVVAGVHHIVRAWYLDTAEAVVPALWGHTAWITKVTAVRGADGRIVAVSSGSLDRSVRIWEIDPEAQGAEVQDAEVRGEPSVDALATSSDPRGSVVAVSEGGRIEVRHADSGATIASMDRSDETTVAIDVRRRWNRALMTVATVTRDLDLKGGAVEVHDLEAEVNRSRQPFAGVLRRISRSRSARHQLDEWPRVATFTVLPNGKPGVVYSHYHDGRYSISIVGNTGRRWGTGIAGTESQINAVGATRIRGGSFVVVSAGGETEYMKDNVENYAANVWRARGGATSPLFRMRGHRSQVNALAIGQFAGAPPLLVTAGGAFSPGSQDDCSVRIWDLETGEPYGEPLKGHVSPVQAVAVAEMGVGSPVVVSGSHDGTIRVWNLNDGTPRIRPLVLGAPVLHIAVLDDRYVVATNRGVVMLEDHPGSPSAQV